MKSQELDSLKQEAQAQCAFPTFMEMVLEAVERVLRNSTQTK